MNLQESIRNDLNKIDEGVSNNPLIVNLLDGWLSNEQYKDDVLAIELDVDEFDEFPVREPVKVLFAVDVNDSIINRWMSENNIDQANDINAISSSQEYQDIRNRAIQHFKLHRYAEKKIEQLLYAEFKWVKIIEYDYAFDQDPDKDWMGYVKFSYISDRNQESK